MSATEHHLGTDFAGRILVRLATDAGHVTAVDIDSTRPQGVTKVFAGRNPDDVVGLLGLIFSLCSNAQTIAGLEAVEAARGQVVSGGQSAARDILRQAEMLTQTAMRVLMDWPRLLDLPPVASAVRAALSAQTGFERALFQGANWKVPGGIAITPNVEEVRDCIADVQGVLSTVLVQDGLADQLLAALDDRDLNGFGALAENAQPETGSLTRHWADVDVARARETFGAGLRARLLARLADLREFPKVMLAASNGLSQCGPAPQTNVLNGEGVATVETARGALTHKVVLKDGRVSVYEIDAPTDVNFLNDGVVAQGLIGVDASDQDALNTAAELHVLAVDPCVSCALEIADA